MKTIKIINDLSSNLVDVISNGLIKRINELDNYQIAWKQIQDIVADETINFLYSKLKHSKFSCPKVKSVYPDVKIENKEGLFAIDIKVGEDGTNPGFDIARLDTIIDCRISKYKEEWELIVRYDKKNNKFITTYFNLLREVVGLRKECNGIKYRPYDGRIRPKTWKDFDNNKIYWNTREEFLIGVENSQLNRWEKNIKQHLVPLLDSKKKQKFINLFQ